MIWIFKARSALAVSLYRHHKPTPPPWIGKESAENDCIKEPLRTTFAPKSVPKKLPPTHLFIRTYTDKVILNFVNSTNLSGC